MSVKHTFMGYLAALTGAFLLSVGATASAEEDLYQLSVGETELVGQFHGDPVNADLRLYMAGNQFVVMDQLVAAFKQQYPEYDDIFYVTIPPGKELNWILQGGVEISAEGSLADEGFILRVQPDVYTTVAEGHMDTLAAEGIITRYYTYAHNRLVLMTAADDPLLGESPLSPARFYEVMADPGNVISEPDILTQGIERHIWQMYTAATKLLYPDDPEVQAMDPTMFDPALLPDDPPESLRRIVYHEKVNAGQTLLTSIHHLETPANIRNGDARLGPVWGTEIQYQQNRLGNTDLAGVEIGGTKPDGKPLNRSEDVNYLATITEGVMEEDHKQAARAFVNFLRGPTAQQILEQAGFIPATQEELSQPHVYEDNDKHRRVGKGQYKDHDEDED